MKNCAILALLFLAGLPTQANAEAIHDAAKSGNVSEIESLLAGGADIESSGPLGTPLAVATRAGQVEAVSFLLGMGADPNVETILGTPLTIALERSRWDIASVILAAGADPDAGPKSKPLLIALRKDDRASFTAILDAGGDPNITEGLDAITALHMIAKSGSHDYLDPLLTAGADPSLLTPLRETALHFALQNNHDEIAQTLEPITDVSLKIEPLDALMASADAERGEMLVHGMDADCAFCHVLGDKPDERSQHQGPTLWSMEGEIRARDQCYDYSAAFRREAGVWDLDSLNWVMAAPAVAFPGTHKYWYPITDPQMRADVIAYLRSLGPPPN